MKFENKVVVVTGASSGIGEGVAKMFLEEGAKVVINSTPAASGMPMEL